MADIVSTYDEDTKEFIVSPVTTRAYEWFAVLFDLRDDALLDGSYAVKSLRVFKPIKLTVSHA